MHWFCNTKFPQMNRYDDWFISGDQMNLQFSNWKSSWRSISECIWFWSILKVHELKACKINNWIHFSQKFDIKITWVFWLFQLLIFFFHFCRILNQNRWNNLKQMILLPESETRTDNIDQSLSRTFEMIYHQLRIRSIDLDPSFYNHTV